MTPQPGRRRRKTSLSTSIIVGTLLVPLSAFAAMSLGRTPSPVTDQPGGQQTAAVAQTAQVVFSDHEATAEDLANACGPAGLELVAAEAGGSITDLQQAGLDALRPICEGQGMALPGKPAPDPIVKTVIVPATSPPATAPPATVTPADQSQPTVATAPASGYQSHESDDGHEHEGESEHEGGGD